MQNGFKDKNHIYAMEVLTDGEWVLGMYDVPIDIASIKKKISEYYNKRGYANNQIRIVKVL